MMVEPLFVVEFVFRIIGRGIVLGPGLSREKLGTYQAGAPIILERPDGSRMRTKIDGFERPIPNPTNVAMILLKGIEDPSVVPFGTKVWPASASEDNATRP